MASLEYMICPEKHTVPFTRDNYAQDFSDGDVDVMTKRPMYEPGFYCLQCERAYGVSKLKEPKPPTI